MASQKKTNAVRILENAKIPFELIEYEVDESSLSAEDAALKTGVPEEQTFKTLCVRGDKTGVRMVCLPAGRELDFKAPPQAATARARTSQGGPAAYRIRQGAFRLRTKKNSLFL